MWSPRNAPAAAATMIPARFGSPLAAKTPAVMTRLSLGTIGKNASSAANANSAAKIHGESIAFSASSRIESATYGKGGDKPGPLQGEAPPPSRVGRAAPRRSVVEDPPERDELDPVAPVEPEGRLDVADLAGADRA